MPDAAPTLGQFLAGWELFRDPILCGVIAGAALGVLGVFVVLRRMVFIAAGLSQAAGLGVALAFFAQIHLGWGEGAADPRLGALILTLAAAVALTREGYGRLTREGVLGMAYLLGAAGTLLVGTRISQEAHDIESILFGTGVVVRPSDLAWIAGVGGAALIWAFWWRRGLVFASFDPAGAQVRGLPVAFLDAALLTAIAVVVSICTRALGALPVFAFSVLPAIAAIVLAPNPFTTMALAMGFGALGGGAGYVVAFFGRFPVGGSQTIVCATIALLALAASTLRSKATFE